MWLRPDIGTCEVPDWLAIVWGMRKECAGEYVRV